MCLWRYALARLEGEGTGGGDLIGRMSIVIVITLPCQKIKGG